MNSSTKKLIEAEKKAIFLFQEIEKRGLIIPGKTEKNINLNAVMSNIFGFGGTNATLVFEKV